MDLSVFLHFQSPARAYSFPFAIVSQSHFDFLGVASSNSIELARKARQEHA